MPAYSLLGRTGVIGRWSCRGQGAAGRTADRCGGSMRRRQGHRRRHRSSDLTPRSPAAAARTRRRSARRPGTASYAAMSKWPWPHRLNRMTRSSPGLLAASASSIAARMACDDSGAGTMPSVAGELHAGLEARVLGVGPGLDQAQLVQVADHRRHAVVAQPAGVDRCRHESRGRACASSAAASCRRCRRSRSGTRPASGWGRRPARPRGSASSSPPGSWSRRNGKAMPGEVRAAAGAADDDVGVVAGHLHLLHAPPGRSPSGAAARGSARCRASTWCRRAWPPPRPPR